MIFLSALLWIVATIFIAVLLSIGKILLEEHLSSNNSSPTTIVMAFVAICISIFTLIGSCSTRDNGEYVRAEPTPTPMASREAEWVEVFTGEGEQANYKCVEVDTPGDGKTLIDCVKTWAGDGPISVPVGSAGEAVPTATVLAGGQ